MCLACFYALGHVYSTSGWGNMNKQTCLVFENKVVINSSNWPQLKNRYKKGDGESWLDV